MAKNEMMLLTDNAIATLNNAELKVSLYKVAEASATEAKSAWVKAVELVKVVRDELFEDDFDSETEFANFCGVSKAMLSQFKGAVKFMEENGLELGAYSVGKAYMLSTMSAEEFEEFITYCNDNDICTHAMSDSALKKLIKEWRKGTPEEVAEVEAVEVEAVEETKEDAEDVSRETIIANIKSLMREWNILIEELM